MSDVKVQHSNDKHSISNQINISLALIMWLLYNSHMHAIRNDVSDASVGRDIPQMKFTRSVSLRAIVFRSVVRLCFAARYLAIFDAGGVLSSMPSSSIALYCLSVKLMLLI
jgi:hypothetical protein